MDARGTGERYSKASYLSAPTESQQPVKLSLGAVRITGLLFEVLLGVLAGGEGSSVETLGWKDTVILGTLSLGVAFMSSAFVLRLIHTGITTAGWDDLLPADDPTSSLLAVIAISTVIYNVLARIKSEQNLTASVCGAFVMLGVVGTLAWLIGNTHAQGASINYLYSGISFFVCAALCLAIPAARRKLAAKADSP